MPQQESTEVCTRHDWDDAGGLLAYELLFQAHLAAVRAKLAGGWRLAPTPLEGVPPVRLQVTPGTRRCQYVYRSDPARLAFVTSLVRDLPEGRDAD